MKKIALIEPAIEKIAEEAGNKYILCNVVSKRAKEILKEKNDPTYDKKDLDIKEITEAAFDLDNKELIVELKQTKTVEIE
ncbi:MAG: DNA-directed RNA polymerase subunit omega [Clostridia bacterium]|nr:DNA-directed RNA polymerase subunit omega [Clostridia bacterium]